MIIFDELGYLKIKLGSFSHYKYHCEKNNNKKQGILS
jgi:hypothetical protein